MSAVLSDCGRYRYRLERETRHPDREGHSSVLFIGVNPSTADAVQDDATVRKWRGFSTAWGFTHFVVGNVFAYRATDVRQLGQVDDPIGPDNGAHLLAQMAQADLIVPCWGATGKVPLHLRYCFDIVRKAMFQSGKPVRIFGLTQSGDPLHPLMLSYSTTLKEWI